MPEMTVRVRWPDGREQDCYSPSLVMHDHLHTGARYTVSDFTARSVRALTAASERVRERYGFACTSAAASAAGIRDAAARFADDAEVLVVSMWPPLPDAESRAPRGTTR